MAGVRGGGDGETTKKAPRVSQPRAAAPRVPPAAVSRPCQPGPQGAVSQVVGQPPSPQQGVAGPPRARTVPGQGLSAAPLGSAVVLAPARGGLPRPTAPRAE